MALVFIALLLPAAAHAFAHRGAFRGEDETEPAKWSLWLRETTWFEGVLLIGVYALLAAGFYHA